MTDQQLAGGRPKAAKKVPAKKAPHSPEKEARRAYEHLGRVRVLLASSGHDRKSAEALLDLALHAFRDKRYKQAADLLRASEHCAFAEILREDKEEVAPELRKEIEHELQHLREKAAAHAKPGDLEEPLKKFYAAADGSARECFQAGAFRSALDFARAAEALTHVHDFQAVASRQPASKRLAS